MREHETRLLAFVILLLFVAAGVARFGEPALAASGRGQSAPIYLPLVSRQGSVVEDLQIVHLGLYQSVQNQSNGVTLVARKPAMLRVHALSSRPAGQTSRAAVTIQASREGVSLGSLTIGPQIVSSRPVAEDLNSTFNVELPRAWLEGVLTLEVIIDKEGVVAETDESNNVRTVSFTFREVPPLDLTIVPITYIDTVTGKTFSEPAHDQISSWLLTAYPISKVNVNFRAPLTFTGNLRHGDEWGRLLEELTSVWAVETGPGSSRIYYGLVPNNAPGGGSWFSGGVSGLGWVGQRVSVGLSVGGETGRSAGHEIGHNLGRGHAPCGNPTSVDPLYPYPDASIGVIGVDTAGETLLDPILTRDVMSYCGPEWVSDYTYEGLLRDQISRGGRTGANKGDGWLVQAVVNDDKVTVLPVRRVNQPFMPIDSSQYRIQLLDGRGRILGSYPAELYRADEEGISTRMLIAHIPAVDSPEVSSIQFLNGGTVITEKSVGDDLPFPR